MTEENLHKHSSDQFLIGLARSGQLGAIDALIERYYSICFRTCMVILRNQDDASDACQNCFVKVVGKLDSFRGDGSFRGWVLTIARNESLALLRHRKMRKESNLENEELYLVKETDLAGKIVNKMEALRVKKALDTLPEKQRLTVRWRID